MPSAEKDLIILGCSATKRPVSGKVPAIYLYDGPAFRVLRSYLRKYRWPERLSLAILSAKYGLIGALSPIANYNQRMSAQRADELSPQVAKMLTRWASQHGRIFLFLGKDYARAIDGVLNNRQGVSFPDGGIGRKLAALKCTLEKLERVEHPGVRKPERIDRPLYFLPDWDDFVDSEFDFQTESFSANRRSDRCELHVSQLVHPLKLCDGILVSLAQHMTSKGLLKKFAPDDDQALAPSLVREHFKLRPDQWAFGDCGAFSYVGEETPPISVEHAVALYDLYGFDLGASVDHIPVSELRTASGKRRLTRTEQLARIRLTRQNAEQFLRLHQEWEAQFIPVGVIQGVTPDDYAKQVPDYVDMGYSYLAIGGLVPRPDAEVLEIVKAVAHAASRLRKRPWIHLLGIFRPKLQALFREYGIASFDSATYFRKAWLRSDQNYLGADGRWYAAIRVPPLDDPRTRRRLQTCGQSEDRLRKLEKAALRSLDAYERREMSVERVLQAVLAYDRLLLRTHSDTTELAEKYRETLTSRIWERCSCRICKELGINVVVFRGVNRNKRRGAHNTLMLYQMVCCGK
ncbi:tRNA-guanine transglycosylase DpdA [Thermogutta sp.]|jgi:hypothetical protein|uniref:tRNA-guanine transglycosylase DpdA n=1 Tax=Thermogutta sp. TaxID=1962930 RepID=UPI00321FB157